MSTLQHNKHTIQTTLFILGILSFILGAFLAITSQPALTGAVVGSGALHSTITTLVGVALIVAALALIVAGDQIVPQTTQRDDVYDKVLGDGWQQFVDIGKDYEQKVPKDFNKQELTVKLTTNNSAAACLQAILEQLHINQSQEYLAKIVGPYEHTKDVVFAAHKLHLKTRTIRNVSAKKLRETLSKNSFVMLNTAQEGQKNHFSIITHQNGMFTIYQTTNGHTSSYTEQELTQKYLSFTHKKVAIIVYE